MAWRDAKQKPTKEEKGLNKRREKRYLNKAFEYKNTYKTRFTKFDSVYIWMGLQSGS